VKETIMRLCFVTALVGGLLISGPVCAQGYDSVSIATPEAESTVHDNNGNVSVQVDIVPPLRVGSGHHLTLLLDGNVVADGLHRHFRLTAIDRGAHTLQAQVLASDGTVIASSPAVQFYMWRASRLFPNRAK
jgi:hypothetical protein